MGLVVLMWTVALPAADFGFSTIIRAGLPNSGDWELGIGPEGNNAAVTANLLPYYPNNVARQFQIGWDAVTQRGYLRYTHTSVLSQALYYSPGFSFTPASTLRWEIPVGGLYVRATDRNRPTGAYLENLTLTGTGLTILQPLGVSSLTATQNGSGSQTTGTTAPVTFLAAGTSSWVLSGTIRFQGLGTYVSGGARRSELHMGFSGGATVESPEPIPALLVGSGLIVFATARRRRGKSGRRSDGA